MVVKIKKQKAQKIESYKRCLKATQLENKINYIEKIKIDIDNINL